LVGSALWRELNRRGCKNLIGRTHLELNLTNQHAVNDFFKIQRPEVVFVAAAKVGGIRANDKYPAQFLYENLEIQNHLLEASRQYGVEKLLFLGSSCVYPRLARQPMRECELLTGPLEPTNQWYAIAKIAGIKLCQAYRREYGCNFIAAMPTNLYGPNDNYDLANSHVLPALVRRFHEAKLNRIQPVQLWGSGSALREFLHVDDLATACAFLMEHYDNEEIINVGSGQEISIRDLAQLVARIVGYDGEIAWDPAKPDGAPRKLVDSQRLFSMGWRPSIDLESGIAATYHEYVAAVAGQGRSERQGVHDAPAKS
jgi:GDP-L-fucose synthase